MFNSLSLPFSPDMDVTSTQEYLSMSDMNQPTYLDTVPTDLYNAQGPYMPNNGPTRRGSNSVYDEVERPSVSTKSPSTFASNQNQQLKKKVPGQAITTKPQAMTSKTPAVEEETLYDDLDFNAKPPPQPKK